MKLLLLAVLAYPVLAMAQVGVGDLNLNCSGDGIGSFNITKSGRHASFNGTAMSLGKDGWYRTPNGHAISIQVFADNSALVNFFPATKIDQNRFQGSAVCSGAVHRYRLRYDRQGFPLYTIVPKDNQVQNRYRN